MVYLCVGVLKRLIAKPVGSNDVNADHIAVDSNGNSLVWLSANNKLSTELKEASKVDAMGHIRFISPF